MNDPDWNEIVTDVDSPGEGLRLKPARSSSSRSGGSEMMAVWGLLILLAITGVGYAFRLALHEEPREVERSARVIPEPEPETPPPPPRRKTPARRQAVAAQPAPATIVERTVEAPKKYVDPIEGFDSGEAFDNPPSPGKYGRRSSGVAPAEVNAPAAAARPPR